MKSCGSVPQEDEELEPLDLGEKKGRKKVGRIVTNFLPATFDRCVSTEFRKEWCEEGK
jgi:hypothetical protein